MLILAGQLAQTASVLTKSLRGLLASVDAIGNSAVRTYDSRLPAAGFGCGWDFRQAQSHGKVSRSCCTVHSAVG